MTITSAFQLRAHTYILGIGEFLGNVFRNLHSAVVAPEPGFQENLCGKTCLITGGNSGIGLATAAAFCQRGCHVVIACRSHSKAHKAVQAIQEMAAKKGKADVGIEVAELNLSSLASVRKLCHDWGHKDKDLDFLIMNAGIMGTDACRKVTPDGHEEHFQVNHLSQWLLAHELMGQHISKQWRNLVKSGLRIVALTSSTHTAGRLDFDNLELEQGYTGFGGYTNSKLANILSVRQMQQFLDRSGGGNAAVAVHPGMIRTSLALNWITSSDALTEILQPVLAIVSRFLSRVTLEPPERAVDRIMKAALAPADQVKGQYMAYGRVCKSSNSGCDMQVAKQLWDRSLQMTGASENGIECQ